MFAVKFRRYRNSKVKIHLFFRTHFFHFSEGITLGFPSDLGWLLVLGHPIFFRSIDGGKGLAGALLGLSCLLIYQKNLGEVLGSGIFVVLLQLERLYSPHCGMARRLGSSDGGLEKEHNF